MAEADSWRVAVGEQQNGPYSFDQVSQMIVEGSVPANALVWKPGMSEWRPWHQLPEFGNLVASLGPPPTPKSAATTIFDYFSFRRTIASSLRQIQLIFQIGVGTSIIVSLMLFFEAISNRSMSLVAFGLASLVLGPLLVRICCEQLIVLSQIGGTVMELSDKIRKAEPTSTDSLHFARPVVQAEDFGEE